MFSDHPKPMTISKNWDEASTVASIGPLEAKVKKVHRQSW